MEEFTNIKEAIYNYFSEIEGKEYVNDVEVSKTDNIYKIVLPQSNYIRPIQIFIEADSEEECITDLIKDLRNRHLTIVKHGKLFKIK